MQKPILVPISIGELLDKITILQIKSDHIEDQDKLTHVQNELKQLTNLCQESDLDLGDSLFKSLKKVNQLLWDIEDQIRNKERAKTFDEEFIALARKIYVTNDERFRIKAQINEKYGSPLHEQKSYKDY